MAENPGQAALLCGAGGALAGAVVGGAASGGKWWGYLAGAAGGAAVGSAACFAIAKASSSPLRDYQQTQQAVGYRPSQGTVVQVERLSIEPGALAPSEDFVWRSDYMVMGPDPNADLQVTETRILSVYDEQKRTWQEVGKIPTTITAKPGTRQDEARMKMPAQPAGKKYQVTFMVEHNNVNHQKSQEVMVVTRQAALPSDSHRVVFEVAQEGSRVTDGL